MLLVCSSPSKYDYTKLKRPMCFNRFNVRPILHSIVSNMLDLQSKLRSGKQVRILIPNGGENEN